MSNFQPVPPSKTNSLAIAGFVMSIICCAPIGLILSTIAMGQINKNPSESGKGLAIAGLVLGVIGIIVGMIYFVFEGSALLSDFESY